MIQLRKATDRGHFDLGWLDTYHTFSFGDYWDRKWMGYRQLRVINEDRVLDGKGFGMHPHRDMEIITYIISGELSHRDSMGNGSVIRKGDVQRMSAGTGVTHSEFNDSKSETCHLLQIWLIPEHVGIEPSYEDANFPRDKKLGRLCPIASPDRRDGSAVIHQDAVVYASILPTGKSLIHEVGLGRCLWVQLISGRLDLGEVKLEPGDGVGIMDIKELRLTATDEAEFLLFDMK